uniref:Tetratricopeptide repeat protein n=1 Tax=Ignavibacterium album TaxID=591197 RepID=A0A832G6T2_9BACT
MKEEKTTFDLNLNDDRKVDLLIDFNRMKKNYFDFYLNRKKSFNEKLNDFKKFFSLQLPVNLGELFVPENQTQILWMFDNPSVLAYENELKEKLSLFKIKHLNLKKYFYKVFTSEDNQKREINVNLFLGTVKSFYGINHFFVPFYKAIVFLYGVKNPDPLLALEELKKAESMLVNLELSQKTKQELSYYLNLYSAYAHQKIAQYESAMEYLNAAIDVNPFGVTARYYLLQNSLLLNDLEQANHLTDKLFKLDLERLKYALDECNALIFDYCITNPLTPYFFVSNEFAPIGSVLEKLITISLSHQIAGEILEQKLNNILNLRYDDYYDQELKNNLNFLKYIFLEQKNISSPFFKMILPEIEKKFTSSAEKLKTLIREKALENCYQELKAYDEIIEDSIKSKEHLEKEIVESREDLQKKLAASIKAVEEYTTSAIQETEYNLAHAHEMDKFNPTVAFNNAMIYNLIVSVIVFIIGAIAGYFNNSHISSMEFYEMFSSILITGAKWTSITFIFGVFVAAGISVFVLAEKATYKQNLKRKINELKKEKELSIDLLKKEAARKEKSITENFNERIEYYKRRIEDVRKEKAEREKHLKSKAEESIKPFIEKIDNVIGFNNTDSAIT